MKRFLILLLCLSLALPAFGAFTATTHWNVQTGGSDSNGGGFDTSATGTDKSQGTATAFTDLVINATNTKASSTTLAFDTTSPGNVLNVTGGTGCTVQRVQISSQVAGLATFDKALGTAGSTCTGTAYGPLLTIATANGLLVNGNTVDIKAGTYTLTAAVSIITSQSNKFSGYNSTPGDGGTKPLITSSTNSVKLFSATGGTAIITFDNLSMSSTAGTRGDGLYQASSGTNPNYIFQNCILDGFAVAVRGDGTNSSTQIGSAYFYNTEIKNSVSNAVSGPGTLGCDGSYIHNNGGDGFKTASNLNASTVSSDHCIFSNNTGAGINGASASGVYQFQIWTSDFVSNSAGGVIISASAYAGGSAGANFVGNNIFYGNTGYGLDIAITGGDQSSLWKFNQHNAYGSNSTAARHNILAGPGDVTLSAGPFTNSGSGDYSLNATAGGGAALSASGFPGVFPGGTSTGYMDIGAVQSGAGHCPACPACPQHAFACAH